MSVVIYCIHEYHERIPRLVATTDSKDNFIVIKIKMFNKNVFHLKCSLRIGIRHTYEHFF